MCGRYGLYRSKMDYENALAASGGLTLDYHSATEIPPNYNVTPTSTVWIARSDGRNVWLDQVQWGLLAH